MVIQTPKSCAKAGHRSFPRSPAAIAAAVFVRIRQIVTIALHHQIPSYSDVLLWDVDTAKAAPAKIALLAMEYLHVGSVNDFISAQHARGKPKTVISIRFRSDEIAEKFIDTLRANPASGMGHLHAARPAVYEKKGSSASGKEANMEKDPW
jgi:serine/threonine protein kinase